MDCKMSVLTKDRVEDLREMKKAASELRKRFDTVQIFCTRHHGSEGTVNAEYGSGDFFARYGVVALWVEKQKLSSLEGEGEDDDT